MVIFTANLNISAATISMAYAPQFVMLKRFSFGVKKLRQNKMRTKGLVK